MPAPPPTARSPGFKLPRTSSGIGISANRTDPDERAQFSLPFKLIHPGLLPIDVLPSILAQLTDRRDWASAALVNRAFNRLATPFLYRTLDSRVISKTFIYHPSTTILARPDLARYVRHVTETGAIHRGMLSHHPNITQHTLAALALCTNLHSLTWIDDSASPTSSTPLLSLLHTVRVIPNSPLRALTIRTHSELGEEVWSALVGLRGLVRVAVWCMEGPPRELGGCGKRWAEVLGGTLTYLELGVSAFSYPLAELLAQLPHLQHLRLKGAPAAAIPGIMALLPELQALDTEYLGSGRGKGKRSWGVNRKDATGNVNGIGNGGLGNGHANNTNTDRFLTSHVIDITVNTGNNAQPLFPTLRHLTIRTSSMDPQKLWTWIRDELVPRPGLETFRLHAYAYSNYAGISVFRNGRGLQAVGRERERARSVSALGYGRGMLPLPNAHWSPGPYLHSRLNSNSNSTVLNVGGVKALGRGQLETEGICVPRHFIMDMGARHGATLRAFVVSEVQLTLADVECACVLFGRLEVLGCALASPDVDSIMNAIAPAKYLHTLKLQVRWIPRDDDNYFDPYGDSITSEEDINGTESADDAAHASISASVYSRNHNDPRRPHAKSWPLHPCAEYFTLADARRMMRNSRLRVVSVGHVQYTGKWVLKETLKARGRDTNLDGNQVGRSGGEDDVEGNGYGRGTGLAFVVSEGQAEDCWMT